MTGSDSGGHPARPTTRWLCAGFDLQRGPLGPAWRESTGRSVGGESRNPYGSTGSRADDPTAKSGGSSREERVGFGQHNSHRGGLRARPGKWKPGLFGDAPKPGFGSAKEVKATRVSPRKERTEQVSPRPDSMPGFGPARASLDRPSGLERRSKSFAEPALRARKAELERSGSSEPLYSRASAPDASSM